VKNSKIDGLLDRHNKLAQVPLTRWTGTEAALEKRINQLEKSKQGAAKAKVVEAPAKTGKAKAAPAAAKEKKPKIGDLIVNELRGGNTDVDDILSKVQAQFPNARTTENSVRWYAGQEKISLRKPKSEKLEKATAPAKATPAKSGATTKTVAKASVAKAPVAKGSVKAVPQAKRRP
jgi:uncharacterized coiled-coil DUF342 family protein